MTDRNKQEQIETEVTYQPFSEFLQNIPPNQLGYISDLGLPESIDRSFIYHRKINTPALELHCLDDFCNGIRFFRCIAVSGEEKDLKQGTVNHLYITYQCSNCKKTVKIYSLATKINAMEQPQGTCYKFGEHPSYGSPVPPRLIKLW